MDETEVFLDGRGVEADKTEFSNNKRQCQDRKQGKTGQHLKREVTINPQVTNVIYIWSTHS